MFFQGIEKFPVTIVQSQTTEKIISAHAKSALPQFLALL